MCILRYLPAMLPSFSKHHCGIVVQGLLRASQTVTPQSQDCQVLFCELTERWCCLALVWFPPGQTRQRLRFGKSTGYECSSCSTTSCAPFCAAALRMAVIDFAMLSAAVYQYCCFVALEQRLIVPGLSLCCSS